MTFARLKILPTNYLRLSKTPRAEGKEPPLQRMSYLYDSKLSDGLGFSCGTMENARSSSSPEW